MLYGTLARILRQLLLVLGGFLVSAGLITGTAGDTFCVDATILANSAASLIATAIGGGSILGSFFWRRKAVQHFGAT